MEDGFPELNDAFLAGQDVFYTQFNEISFYVEDTGNEHFYFNIFKRLFPLVKFEKIFPLNGKTNVINEAQQSIGDNKKVFIVDLDFDEILGTKTQLENVFYLEKYSIENYLLNKSALFEIIRERHPNLKNQEIEAMIDFDQLYENCKLTMAELALSFIVIRKYNLGIPYCSIQPARDFNFAVQPPIYRGHVISNFFSSIDIALKTIDGRFTLRSKMREFQTHFQSLENSLANIPGKYLMNSIKYLLERANLILQVNLNSFSYKLSKECDITQLNFLRVRINEFVA